MFFILFFLLLFGGAIGSFLNVVIYRLPAGMNLSYPASHCPKCGHPIRPYDNVPVFGWIFLHGKCRDCKAPISVRYPLVEGFCAILFVNVGYAVLVHRPFDELEQSLGMIAYYLLLLTTLFAAAMIDYDGKKIPVKLFIPVMVVALVVSWINGSFNVIFDVLLELSRLFTGTPVPNVEFLLLGTIPPFIVGGILLLSLLLLQKRLPLSSNRAPILVVTAIFVLYFWFFAFITVAIVLLYFWVAYFCRCRIFSMFPFFISAWLMVVGTDILRLVWGVYLWLNV